MNSQLGTLPSYHHVELYHSHPSEVLESDIKKVPRIIRLTFTTVYSGTAAASWVEDGFFGADSDSAGANDWNTGKAVYLTHEILFEPDTIKTGTFSFDLGDTTGSRKKISMRVISLGWPENTAPALAPLELKGNITIQNGFTGNTGKFTYALRAVYASGQKSSFEGSAEFRGVIKDVDCGMSGP